METLKNDYIKVEPTTHSTFMVSEKTTYDEMAKVVLSNDPNIPIGSIIKFDSWLIKKYPKLDVDGEFDWYIKATEVVSCVTPNE